MGVMTNGVSEKEVNYTFHRKAGRSIIERRPVFSPDGEYVELPLLISLITYVMVTYVA